MSNTFYTSEPKIELVSTVNIPITRYDELLESHTKLEILEKALKDDDAYLSVTDIKRIIGFEKEVTKNGE